MRTMKNTGQPIIHIRLPKHDKTDFGMDVAAVPLEDEYETYRYEDLPKDTQEIVDISRARRAGKKMPKARQFTSAAELSAFLNEGD